MLSPYRNPSNSCKTRNKKISNTNLGDDSHRERDFKRLQTTPTDLESLQKVEFFKTDSNADSTVNHTTNKRSKLKIGPVYEIDEINNEYLDEFFIMKTYNWK